uniref:N-acetylneuraminate synthase family protein n=1 Tax=Roseihalotalea indica TaxID=2867963 RepID=A0AA49GK45_9BACT|nr:N-acetylneuraminate synthase family protein [Tunicatimonas sp. TK19036]
MSSFWKGKHGPLLIAEIGGNHEGDFEYARRLTELALEADVDYIKFQLYQGDTLVSREESPQRNQHFKKFELSQEFYLSLAELCHQHQVGFLASVWDTDYFSWIDPHMDFYKIGSGDLTAYPILKATAQLGKPMLISTGLATLDEVLSTVDYIQSVNKKYQSPDFLAILQCTSMYPIPFEDANLSVMSLYKQATQLPVGYSDHTVGSTALEVAVAMGAEILEFHFTDTREGKTFRDHQVSLTRDEVKKLIQKIQEIKSLQGSSLKRPLPVEGDHRISFRRAVYPKTDLPAGTLLTEEHLTCLRPNHGIDAREFDQVVGKTLNTDVRAHQKLSWQLLD